MEDLSCKFLDGGYTVGTRGTIKPCCVMRGVPNQPFWENKHHQEVDWWKEVKSDLESGIRHPYCYACWNLEAVGERSTRNHGNDWFWFLKYQVARMPRLIQQSFSEERIGKRGG